MLKKLDNGDGSHTGDATITGSLGMSGSITQVDGNITTDYINAEKIYLPGQGVGTMTIGSTFAVGETLDVVGNIHATSKVFASGFTTDDSTTGVVGIVSSSAQIASEIPCLFPAWAIITLPLADILNLFFAELFVFNFGINQFEWRINGGSITAIPLSGEKIRGFRANILVLDEYLLLPEETIKTVLMPFLVAPQDMAERIRVREIEDGLIKSGKMEEKDRMVFENKSKMIALSSASYSFENLYKTYKRIKWFPDWTIWE